MKKITRSYLIISFSAAMGWMLAGCYDGNEPLPNFASYDFSAVDSLLAAPSTLKNFNHNVLVIVQQDGRQVYSDTVGDFTPQTRLLAASASKFISAAVILSLVDRGLLQLDDSIGSYLSVFSKYGKGKATIRQCFTMTSGFEECRSGDHGCPITNTGITLDEDINRIAKTQPMVYKPGSTVFYSSIGMQIAGRIAEIVSGKSWGTLLKENITGPCKMASSDFGEDNLNPYIAGGLHTTAEDYLNFLQMILNKGKFSGKTVLSPTAIQEYFTPQTLHTKPVESPYPFPPPFYPYAIDTVHYGFGSWQDVVNPDTHEVEQVSSPGAFGMFPWVDRKRNIIGVVFTDSSLDKTLPLELQLVDLVRKAVDQPKTVDQPSE